MRRAILLSLVLLAFAVGASQSYWVNGPSWPSGTVPIQIELGADPALTDGCADWSCVASGAIDRWNLFMGRVQLRAIANSQHSKGEIWTAATTCSSPKTCTARRSAPTRWR